MEITPFPQSFSLLLYSKMVKKKKKGTQIWLTLVADFHGSFLKKNSFLKNAELRTCLTD